MGWRPSLMQATQTMRQLLGAAPWFILKGAAPLFYCESVKFQLSSKSLRKG